MFNHPFSEEIFPNIHPEPPLVPHEAISLRPFSSCLGEEANPQWNLSEP